MNSTRRRKDIIKLIERIGNVTVEDLTSKYRVSEETIRRDLRMLDKSGHAKRVYGGAVRHEKTTRYLPLEDRLSINRLKKEEIAKKAVKLLEDGDSVFIDGKTTCLIFSQYISPELDLTIVTNSMFLANELFSQKGNFKVHLVGGEINSDGMTTGPKLHQELKGYRFDKAFFSCIGLNVNGCFYSKTEPQQLAHTLSEISHELILLADSSKINKNAFLFGMALDQFKYIVTDKEAPLDFLDKMSDSPCKVIHSETMEEKFTRDF